MTLESRLREALHEVDRFQPSVDLFARVKRSVAEDARFRRRRATAIAGFAAVAALTSAFLASSVRRVDGTLMIATTNLVMTRVALSVVLLVVLAPNIRRFAVSYVDDVFHLSPETGARFLAVLDVAYYLFFSGLLLVDADVWNLGSEVPLAAGLEEAAWNVGLFLVVMGVLHAVNIASLPVLGLIFNATTRRVLRARAGADAPPESMRARRADGNARGMTAALVVLAGIAAFLVLSQLVLGQG